MITLKDLKFYSIVKNFTNIGIYTYQRGGKGKGGDIPSTETRIIKLQYHKIFLETQQANTANIASND